MRITNPSQVLLLASLGRLALSQSCPDYLSYSRERHPPFSSGKYALPYQRPSPECRTFNSADVEDAIRDISSSISDPDLYRLFQNSFPNTLDTAIRWHGVAANNSNEELTFIITGDINAMWLRDSANQLQSYHPLLKPNTSLASLYRGVINLQSRYLLTSPFCNSFQPPLESNIPPTTNSAANTDTVFPPYDPHSVFECKYELDSLAAFLQISSTYHSATHDTTFFSSFQWVPAIRAVLSTAKAMMTPTYGPDGKVLPSPYTFARKTTRSTETLANDGLGSPVASDTGLIRSAFRPSDDSTLFQLLIPSNMMFASYLGPAATILSEMGESSLAEELTALAASLRAAITKYGIVHVPRLSDRDGSETETIYAYEADGFGSTVIMDDANIPSLLAAPVMGYLAAEDEVYRRTRARILDEGPGGGNGNPYFMRGPVINSVGGPHAGPGMAWPMASVVRILTSNDEEEIFEALREILGSTDGRGLVHESVDSWDGGRWTRPWLVVYFPFFFFFCRCDSWFEGDSGVGEDVFHANEMGISFWKI